MNDFSQVQSSKPVVALEVHIARGATGKPLHTSIYVEADQTIQLVHVRGQKKTRFNLRISEKTMSIEKDKNNA